MSLPACEHTAPNSSASWTSTKTSIGSAMSAAPTASSSRWPSSSAEVLEGPRVLVAGFTHPAEGALAMHFRPTAASLRATHRDHAREDNMGKLIVTEFMTLDGVA